MKIKNLPSSILRHMTVVVALAFSSSAMAAVVVSNLGESDDASSGIFNPAQRLGSSFTVANTSGFQLDNISVNGSLNVGAVGSLSMDLYTDGGSNTPGSLIATFSATNPSFGVFSFTPGSAVTLTAGDTYFWAVRSSEASGEFRVRLSASFAQSGDPGWLIGDNRISSGDSGATWSDIPLAARFSVSATAVPEPSAAILGLVSALALGLRRRR